MSLPGVASVFVEETLAAAAGAGLARGPLLAATGLADTAAPVTAAEFGRLWRGVAEAMGDEFLGLGARPMRPGSFALMGHAVLHAGTLDRALRRALRFLAVVLDDPRGELRLAGGEAEIVLVEDAPPRSAFAYRTWCLIVMGLACWLVGRRIAIRRLDFACPAPEAVDYRQFFGVPVRFGTGVTRLSFDAGYLRLPVIRSEAALAGFLREAPGNILLRYRHDRGMAAEVRAQLTARPPVDWPGFEAMAAELGLAPATLRRRLRGEGQGYAAIKDELRLALAGRLLAEGRLSVAEVAGELGYSEPSAFHRAFRGWTGSSPRQTRHSHVNDPAIN